MKYLKLNSDLSNLKNLAKKVALYLKKEKVGAIPTETFYGLAADPFSEKALKKLISLKKRPQHKPILLLISSLDQLSLIVKDIPPVAEKLIEKFWPGPLTIVFSAKEGLSPILTAGTDTIGVRFSSSPVVKKIIKAFGKPITGTSANISNNPPCRSPEEVVQQLPELDFVLDAGPLKSDLPSTVVSVIDNQISLIRTGAIPFKEILNIFL